MKLAALYTLFNGTELLEKSIAQIKDQVDLVVLGMQEVSNAGNEMDTSDAMNIAYAEGQLKEQGRESVIINYRPDLSLHRKNNERLKLNKLLQTARMMGATHWILLAADHYYDPEQFAWGKQHALEYDMDVTATRMYTYYKKPTWRLTKMEDYWMPFICKLRPETRATSADNYPMRVDPAVRVQPAKSFMRYEPDQVIMHHYSMCRKDILSKFTNAAAAQRWSRPDRERYLQEWLAYDIEKNPGISYFGGQIVEKTVDKFGLESIDF